MKLQKSDKKIKKASNGLTYAAGNEVTGKYGMSFFGMTMKMKTSDLVVNHID